MPLPRVVPVVAVPNPDRLPLVPVPERADHEYGTRNQHEAMSEIAIRLVSEVWFALSAQQRLYFLPLPQWQGSFRPIAAILHPLVIGRASVR